MDNILKNCVECKVDLELQTNFYKNKSNKDGYVNICKKCKTTKYREKHNKYQKTYYKHKYNNDHDFKAKELERKKQMRLILKDLNI